MTGLRRRLDRLEADRPQSASHEVLEEALAGMSTPDLHALRRHDAAVGAGRLPVAEDAAVYATLRDRLARDGGLPAVTASLARRVKGLEASSRLEADRRWGDACDRIRRTLAPEHARLIADWLHGPGAQTRASDHDHGLQRVCARCISDAYPPSLVRAALLMALSCAHGSASPIALPPAVAEIYLADPDAWPANPCEGCGYLLPTRSKIRPDGTYRHIGAYCGACPVCGLDNHPEEEGSA